MKLVKNRVFSILAILLVVLFVLTACTYKPDKETEQETFSWTEKQIFTQFAEMLNNPTPQNSKLTASIKLSMDSGNDGWVDTITEMSGIAADNRIYLKLSMQVDEYLYRWEDVENEPGVTTRVKYLDISETVNAEIWMDIETGEVVYSVEIDDESVNGNYNLYSDLTPEEIQQLEQYLEEMQQLSETHKDVTYKDLRDYLYDNYLSVEVFASDSRLLDVKLVLSSDYVLQQGLTHKPNTTVYVTVNEDGTYNYKLEENGYLGVVGKTTFIIESVTEVVPTNEKVEMPSANQ